MKAWNETMRVSKAAITVNTYQQSIYSPVTHLPILRWKWWWFPTNHIIHSNWTSHLLRFQCTNHPSLVSGPIFTLERKKKDCNKSMLREYQRELNDSVWPGGITLHQEARFYTTSRLSALIFIYLLTKLQPFQFRSALKHAAYRKEVREQREDAD